MRRVLRLAGVMQDRPCEPIRGIDMRVGQTREGRSAVSRPVDLHGRAIWHFDDLGELRHDDMTIQRGETFTTS